MRRSYVASMLGLLGALVAAACSGAQAVSDGPDAGETTGNDAAASAQEAAASPPGECAVDADCASKLPTTTPPDCAEAMCDPLVKKCHFVAKDSDGDGHPAKSCSATLGVVETGDDCDDHEPATHPGAWDGPSRGGGDAGAGSEPDRCDQKDNDCNGSIDDGTIPGDGGVKACACDPANPPVCYELSSGAAIDPATLDAQNKPKGACRKGARSCINGVPGQCLGAVGPTTELCDTVDHDCNGASGDDGNAGIPVAGAPLWYRDLDTDSFGDLGTSPKQQCRAPDAAWRQTIPNTDCNDNDATVHPSAPELCDGKDNNCNVTVDEGFNVGSACSVGTGLGACNGTGTIVCDTGGGAKCQPPAGVPSPSGHSSAAVNGSWDWSCDGAVQRSAGDPFEGSYAGDCANFNVQLCADIRGHNFPNPYNGQISNCGGTVGNYRCKMNGMQCVYDPSIPVNNYPQYCW